MPGQMQVDQMRALRDQASQRLEILIPISFTSIDVGTVPRRIFGARFPVSSVMFQASHGNAGRIHIGTEESITTDYGFGLSPGASVSWAVTLTDILQILGWDGLSNNPERGRTPQGFNPFRQSRIMIDAGQFWAVATDPDQDLSIQFSVMPRY